MQWTTNKATILFDALPNINEVEEKESINTIKNNNNNENIENNIFTSINNNNIKDENIINNEKQKKIRRRTSNLKTAILEKNPKFNYSNIDIIKNIDELHREINRFEFTFIDDKELFLNNLIDNYL